MSQVRVSSEPRMGQHPAPAYRTNQPDSAQMPPAVLCGWSLDMARRLDAEGIRVYTIDTHADAYERHSKALQFVYCPYSLVDEEEAYLDFLVDFAKSLGTKPVLYPLADRQVMLLSRYRAVLRDHFLYVMPPHETIMRLTTKDGLDSMAREYAIPAPRTFVLSGDSDIRDIAERVVYPALIKPTQSPYWHTPAMYTLLRKGIIGGRAKFVQCGSPQELVDAVETIAAVDPRMVVQELIPGGDDRLVYASFYVDRSHDVRGYFAGRKLRIIPEGAASFAETFTDPKLQRLVFKIVTDAGYEGLGGLEFKQDPRDGEYKLIEFNSRFGGWSGLGLRCGVDLPLMAYRDALGLPLESQLECRPGARWVHLERDVRAFVDYRKKGQLTFREWLRSLKGPKMVAIYSRDDWRLGIAYTLGVAAKIVARTWNHLAGNLSREKRSHWSTV